MRGRKEDLAHKDLKMLTIKVHKKLTLSTDVNKQTKESGTDQV